MVVQALYLAVELCLAREPLEERQPVGAHALRMPLHAEHGLVLAALDGFDDAVGGGGHGTEVGARVGDGLVVEGVDG